MFFTASLILLEEFYGIIERMIDWLNGWLIDAKRCSIHGDFIQTAEY